MIKETEAGGSDKILKIHAIPLIEEIPLVLRTWKDKL